MTEDEMNDIIDGNIEPKKEEVDDKPTNNRNSDTDDYDSWMENISPKELDKSKFKRFERSYTLAFGPTKPPANKLEEFQEAIELANAKGFTMRSGADYRNAPWTEELEKGVEDIQYYVPWEGVLGDKAATAKATGRLFIVDKSHFDYAAKLHGAFDKIPNVVKKFITANAIRLFSPSMDKPVRFILVYSEDGAETRKKVDYKKIGNGFFFISTGSFYDIPIFNFYNEDGLKRFKEFLSTNFKD